MHTDATLSQLNIWSDAFVDVSARRCFGGNQGDVLAWKQLEDADIDGAYIKTPSVCDGKYYY